MASDFNGYIQHRQGYRFYVVYDDIMEILNGDEIGAAFVDVLYFRSTCELRDRFRNAKPPKEWPEDLWVQKDMVGVAGSWMFGGASVKSIQLRAEWLEASGIIETRQFDRSAPKAYRLNVGEINRLLRSGGQIQSVRDFSRGKHSRSAKLPVEPNSRPAILPYPIGNFAGQIADPSLSYKDPTLYPFHEEPDPLKAETPLAYETEVDTRSSLKNFTCRLFKGSGLEDPRLTKQKFIYSWMRDQERVLGADRFRAAMVGWFYANQEWISKTANSPFLAFRSRLGEYLPDAKPEVALQKRNQWEADKRFTGGPTKVPNRSNGASRDQGFMDRWNETVTSKPCSGSPPPVPDSPDLTPEAWDRICNMAQRAHEVGGDRNSWMNLRWVLDPKKENWRRMLDGDFAFTAAAPHDSKPEDGSTKVIRRLKAEAEAAKKKREQEKQS